MNTINYYKRFNRFEFRRARGNDLIPSIDEYLDYRIPQKIDKRTGLFRDKYWYELTIKESTYFTYINNIWFPLGRDLNPNLNYSILVKYSIKDGVRDRD